MGIAGHENPMRQRLRPAFRLSMRLVLLAALNLVAPFAAAAEDWPTTEFEVLIVDPDLQRTQWAVFGPLQQALASLGLEIQAFGHEFPDETRAEIEQLLHESAELLKTWGFPPPNLRAPWRSGGVFRVFIVENLDVAGRYHPTDCRRRADPMIFIDADDILRDGVLTEDGRSVVTHELVHAIQFNMPFFNTRCERGSAGPWIMEGTAEAMGWDLVRLLYSLELPGREGVWGPRSYSDPLPVPVRLKGLPPSITSITPDPYMTASFWRYLAELYASRQAGRSEPGVVAATPFDYRYLSTLFGRPPPARDCDELEAPCTAELRWLDQRLREAFGAPLHDLYTRFVGTAVLYGENDLNGRAFGATNSTRWRRKLFYLGCPEVELTPEKAWHTERMILSPTAAQCYAVSFSGFGGDVNLEVTVEGTENSWRVGDLSAIVARNKPGQSQLPMRSEPQRAEPRTDLTKNTPAVDWLFGMPDEATSYLLITNVADDPAQTIGLSELTVHFIAKYEYVSMAIGGSTDGEDADGDSGPTPAEIDQPYPIDFDVAEGEFSIVHDAPLCRIWLKLRSQQGDALWIAGVLPAPITPDTYLISQQGGGVDPGVFGGQLWTTREFARGAGRLHSSSGNFEIESVNPALIIGRVETQVGSGMMRANVHAEFSLPPLPVEGILGPDAPAHPCLAPAEDAAGPEGGTGQGQRGASHQSDTDTNVNEESGVTGQEHEGDSGETTASDDSDDEASGFDGFLEFPAVENSGLRSAQQRIRGTQTDNAISAASSAFDLVILMPFDKVMECLQSGQHGVMWLLTKAGAQDNVYVLELSAAQLNLEVGNGLLRLELGLDDANVVIQADSGVTVESSAAQGEGVQLDVEGAALQVTAEGSTGTCEELIDVSFRLQYLE